MKLGNDKIFSCPKCQDKVSTISLISGNTFGATIYSDGITVSPMLPQIPDMTKCRNCGHIFDLNQQTLITDSIRSGESQYRRASFLTVADYQQLLDLALKDEKEMRLMMWHTGNGTFGDQGACYDHLYQKNCQKLIELLSESEDVNELITLAELHRNIGDFKKCLNIIKQLDDSLNWLKTSFIKQCENKNKKTFIIR